MAYRRSIVILLAGVSCVLGTVPLGPGPVKLPPKCTNQVVCTAQYEPVCARNPQGNSKTFGNKCEIEKENACKPENMRYKQISEGECCSKVCPQYLTLFCIQLRNGTNMELETNPCFLSIQSNGCNNYNGYLKGATIIGPAPCPKPPGCNQIVCTAQYDPVCGQNPQGDSKTFGNSCEIGQKNACLPENERYKQISTGACPPQCGTISCTADFDPVCGRNANGETETFSNSCQMKVRNACLPENLWFKQISPGACPPECGKISCTREYNPVCGRNAKGETETFSNPCELKAKNACYPENLRFKQISPGACPPECGKIACTLEYNPVCGKNANGETETFSNPCQLKAKNACYPENLRFKQISTGACPPQCGTILCHADFDPVCGRNANGETETFSNRCQLTARNSCLLEKFWFTEISPGACPSQCGTILCPANYDPVCGRNAKGETETFSNACQITARNSCQPELKFRQSSTGECPVRCEQFCPQYFAPTSVCVLYVNGTRSIVQANPCIFNNQANGCDNYMGPFLGAVACSTPCIVKCPRMPVDPPPVCAVSTTGSCKQTTFSSQCAFDTAVQCQGYQGKIIRQGKCLPGCPKISDPICATNSCGNMYRTFKNACYLSNTPGWTQVCRGPCAACTWWATPPQGPPAPPDQGDGEDCVAIA